MRRSSGGRSHGRTTRRDLRRWLTLEGLEDRRLLTWTFSISGSVASAVSDGSSDTLYIVQSGGNLYHSVDGTNFSPDWSGTNSGTTLAASSSSTVNIDPTSGSTAHAIFLGDYRLAPAATNQAQINIINGGSNVALTIDDSTDTSAASGTNAYTINNGVISTPLGINVNASGSALGGGITLEGGTQADTFNLTGSRAGEGVTLTGGNGGNTFNVTSSSSPTTINVGGGTNTVSLGGTAGEGTQLLTGATTLVGSGATTVAIDDLLGTNSPQTVNLNATQLIGLAPGTIDFSGLSHISTFAMGTTNLGGATLDVTGAPVASSVVRLVSGSGGINTYRIGDASHAFSGFPSELFQIVSTGSTMDLTVDDEADSSAATVAVSNSTLSLGASQPRRINYASASLASLTFDGGSGGNTINVTGTPGSITTTINSGTGVDSVAVQATGSGGTLNLDTQGGTSADHVTLGGLAGVGARHLFGTVNLQSTGGSYALTVDGSQDTAAQTVALSASQLTGLSPSAINLTGSLSALTVKGGSGGNTFTVAGTPALAGVTLDTGSGNDSVAVHATGSGGTLTIDTQGGTSADGVTLGGVASSGAQDLLGTINVQSTGGSVDLTIDDSQDTADQANVQLSGSQLSGLAPAAIDFSNLSNLAIDASAGTDSVVVSGTPAGATVTLSMSSSTTNALALGTAAAAASTLGSMTINGTFGLTIDDSADATGGTLSFQGAGISFGSAPLPTFGYFGDYIKSLRMVPPTTAPEAVDIAFSPYLPMGTQILVEMGSSTSNAVQIGVGGLGASRLNGVTVTGTMSLTIDDTNSTGAHPATITSSSLDLGPSTPTFVYSGATLTGLTFAANSAGSTVDVVSSPAGAGGPATLTLNLPSSPATTVNLGNSTNAAADLGNVSITGLAALVIDDTADATTSASVTVNRSAVNIANTMADFSYSGAVLSSLTFDAGSGGTSVTVAGSPSGPLTALSPLTLNMGTAQGNRVNLGGGAADALGNVTLNGDLALIVDDSASGTSGWTIGVTATTIDFSNGTSSSTFDATGATLSSLTFDGGSGGNTINVTGTPASITTTINSGTGVDSVAVQATGSGGTLDLDTQGGPSADSVTLGGAAGSGAQGLLGTIKVQSTGGLVALTIDDAQDTAPRVASLGAAQLTGLAPAAISFGDLSSLAVNGGSGGNTVLVAGTPDAITTDLRSGTAIDNVQVQATGAGGTLNLDTQGGNSADTVTLGGAVGAGAQDLLGTINVQSTGGFAVLDVDDSFDTNGRSVALGSAGTAKATLAGIAPATINVSLDAVGNMGIKTGTAADTLTVDCTAGDPLPAILRFSGQGSNTLDLRGAGAGFASESYLATGPGAGSLSFDGAHQILFSQLTPINDTVPVSTFNFAAPAGSTALNLVDGPTVDGFATTQIASPTGAFELINLANKASATATASSAATTIDLDNPDPAVGLQSLMIVGGSGGNTVNVTAAPAGVSTAINLGGGGDQAVVSSDALPVGGTLHFDGGPGTNDLRASAPTTTASVATAGTVAFGTGASFGYQNIQTLELVPINQPPAFGAVGSLASTAGQAMSSAVVARFTDADAFETASGYAATISWGDGTVSAGTIVADATTPGLFEVIGSHTYQATGSFAIEVSLTDRGGTFASTADTTAVTTTLAALGGPIDGHGAGVTVHALPIVPVLGGLTPGSVTGPLGPDGFAITRVNMPAFSGSAAPGATIRIFATGTSAGAPDILIATATADSAGHWSASDTAQPLPDGPVMFHATTGPGILPAGVSPSAASTMFSLGGAIVDIRGPLVTGMAFDRLQGRLTLTFQDGLSGLDEATLSNTGNYQIAARPIRAGIHVPRSLAVTHVVLAPPASPTDPVTVVLTINQGHRLRGGRYFFKVSGLGVRDLAGNGLNGTFNGSFPTGGGLYPATPSSTGSDFLAEVTTFRRKALRPAPVNPSASTMHPGISHGGSAQPHATRVAPAAARLHDAALAALAMPERDGRRPR